MALTVNRRLVIRPNAFLCLLILMFVEALLTLIRHEYLYETMFGTAFRTARLAGFVATLWLLTPWWGRRDMLLVRCHIDGHDRWCSARSCSACSWRPGTP